MLDPETLNSILTTLGRLEAQMAEVKSHTVESDRALRGSDGEPGVVARLSAMQVQVAALSASASTDHELLKEVAKTQKDYPSVTWLLRYKPGVVTLAIGLLLSAMMALPLLGFRLLAVVLHALGVPDVLIEFYLGT